MLAGFALGEDLAGRLNKFKRAAVLERQGKAPPGTGKRHPASF
jgi:hypothetical protein